VLVAKGWYWVSTDVNNREGVFRLPLAVRRLREVLHEARKIYEFEVRGLRIEADLVSFYVNAADGFQLPDIMQWWKQTRKISNIIILTYAKNNVKHYRHFFTFFLIFSYFFFSFSNNTRYLPVGRLFSYVLSYTCALPYQRMPKIQKEYYAYTAPISPSSFALQPSSSTTRVGWEYLSIICDDLCPARACT
jgi:REP element-mobilizing transposase RayT